MGDILIVSRQRLAGAHNGSSAYLLQIARSLRDAGHAVHLVQPSPSLMGRRPVLRLAREMDVFASHAVRGVSRFGRLMISRDPRVWLAAARGVLSSLARRAGVTTRWSEDRPAPYAVAETWSEADRAFLRAAARGRSDFVIADYIFQALAFEEVPVPRARRAILMHDLFHARPGDARDSVASVSPEEEVALLGRAGAVIAIQRREADFVREHVPAARVILAPMAAESHASHPSAGQSGRVLFVGSRTAPNTHGLRWLLDEVWPLVLAHHPGARLDVTGTVCDDFTRGEAPGVVFHGKVETLDPFYDEAGVVISPLLFGSGLKIKLVEAMGRGKAIVATGVTLQGVEEDCSGAVLRADEAEAFAHGIGALIEDGAARARLGEAALSAAVALFGPERAHRDLLDWIESEDPGPRTAGAAPTLPHPA